MFYNADTPNLYPGLSYPGMGFIFNAPLPDRPDCDWLYCADVSESLTQKQKEKEDSLLHIIIKNRISIKSIFSNDRWKIIHETKDTTYPREIYNNVKEYVRN